GPAGPGHEHNRCDARLRKTHPRVDLRVPSGTGLEVTSADVGVGRTAVRSIAQAANHDPEGGEWIYPPQRGRDQRIGRKHQPSDADDEMTITAERARSSL